MTVLQCPFHGEIIPRDESGKCINPEDELKLKAAEEEKKIPDWQDPQLLKDIQVSLFLLPFFATAIKIFFSSGEE